MTYYLHKVPLFLMSQSQCHNFYNGNVWPGSGSGSALSKMLDPDPHWHHFCCSGGMRSGDAMRRGSSAGRPPGGVPGLQRIRPELRHYRQQRARTRHWEGGLCLLHLRHGDGALPEGDDCGVCRALPAGGRAGQVTTNVVFSWCYLMYSVPCSRILSPWLGD
jgi:hypothetical protein